MYNDSDILKPTILDDNRLKLEAGELYHERIDDYIDVADYNLGVSLLLEDARLTGNGWGLVPMRELNWMVSRYCTPISSDLTVEDDGSFTVNTVWYWPDYVTKDMLKVLDREGEVFLENGLKEGRLEEHLGECPACRAFKEGV